MSSSFRSRAAASLLIASVGAVLTHRADAAPDYVACVDSANPASAMDERIVQAAAATQHASVTIHRFDGSGLGDDSFAPKNFPKLANDKCQLILGFPVDTRGPLLPDGVMATAPYAQTGFALVTRSKGATQLNDLPKGSEVAVTYETAPNLFFLDHPDISSSVFPLNEGAIAALYKGEVKAAMIWQPAVVDYQNHHPKQRKLFYTLLDEPHARWNLVALYAAPSAAIARSFEQGVRQLQAAGQLAALTAPFAIEPQSVVSANPPTPSAPAHLLKVAIKVANKKASTKRPAIYTAEQATAGQGLFMVHCSMCHGAALEGRTGPALKGEKFASVKENFAVADIFIIMATQMPAGNPGTLKQDEYVDIMSFLLQQNGYPAGDKALSYDGAQTSKVPLIFAKS